MLFSRKFNEYLQRYEKKLRLKCDDKELGKSDAQYLELLENILTLESIRDARFYCKENVKVKKVIFIIELIKFKVC